MGWEEYFSGAFAAESGQPLASSSIPVLNIKSMTVADAVELIADNARLQCFQITADSRRVPDDLASAARIQALLIEAFPAVNACVKDGTAFVSIQGPLGQQDKQVNQVRSSVWDIEGVRGVRVHFVPVVVAG